MAQRERFQRAAEIYLKALRVSADQRAALLEQECADDAALRALVNDLLAAADEETAFRTLADGLGTPVEVFRAELQDRTRTFGTTGLFSGAGREEAAGMTIGRYTLVEQIGEGGFGAVFLAEQREPVRRKVALKIIKLGMDTRQVIARFEQERQALALMDHPNIAKVLDAGATDTGRPYFVMELCPGFSITDYCDRESLSIADRLHLFVQVCQAVQHAHQRGLIHRDIKPSNILVSTQDGRPRAKVIDFGIAKATAAKLTEKTVFTEHRQFIGTPQYMSPEQAAGSLDIDTRTDVYSLGVLLYELLIGCTPFDGRTLRSAAYDEIQRVIREVEPPRLSTRLSANRETLASVAATRQTNPQRLGSVVRGELEWIVMKALEKDRQRRYESPSSLATDIEHYLTGQPVAAAPPSRLYRLRKLVRRHRVTVTAAALIMAAILLGSGLAVAGFVQARQQRDLALAAERRAVAEKERATEAERTAKREAENATQITNFLAEMLKGVEPGVARGQDTTLMREVLDKTADAVERELGNQPAVASRVLRIISSVYNALAVYDRSEETARRSVALAEKAPEVELGVARAQFDLAKLLESTGRYNEARELFQQVYDAHAAADQADSADALAALSAVGGVYYRLNDYDKAEPIFRDVLERRRRLYGLRDHKQVAESLSRLGLIYAARPGDEKNAVKFTREAIAMSRRIFGDVHPDVAVGLNNLASTLSRMGRFDEALAAANESLAQHIKLFGDDHPYTAQSYATVALIYFMMDRLDEALDCREKALAICLEKLGPDHRTTLNMRWALSEVLMKRGDWAAAEEQHRVMLDFARRKYPAGDNRTLSMLALIAEDVRQQGRLEEAIKLHREALEGRLAGRPKGHPQISQTRNALADCLVQAGNFAEAEPLLLDVERDALLAQTPNEATAAARTRLASFYDSWAGADPDGGHEEAAAHWRALEGTPPTTAPAALAP